MKRRKNNERASYEVWLDAPELDAASRVGHLHHSLTQSDLPPSFAYDGQWLASPKRFMLDPRLELWQGEQYPQADQPNFGILMDSAPDRWGRVLLERREAAQAESEQRPMRALQEIDFLLGIHDFTRMGALRFRASSDTPFLANHPLPAPPVTRLTELAYISARIEEPGVEKLPEYEKWLAMLIAPGSSLGGARPKANFTDSDGSLWFAKFPAHDDRVDIGGWEYLAHTLAARAGITVSPARRVALGGRHHTFCVQRFDRQGSTRRMFASAMTLLQQQDGNSLAGYPDLAQFIADAGQQNRINADCAQLFRRVLFNVLIGNRDDHLRNHGFIRGTSGWMLSPAFDMNPNPNRAGHVLPLDGVRTEPEVRHVLATADWYRLGKSAANQILAEVRAALADWRTLAEQQGLPGPEIARMASVIQA